LQWPGIIINRILEYKHLKIILSPKEAGFPWGLEGQKNETDHSPPSNTDRERKRGRGREKTG
jgi:hypothetical protein